jgi:hypothetical protein
MERDSLYSFITTQSLLNLPNILNIVLPAGKAKSSVETLFLPPFHTDPSINSGLSGKKGIKSNLYEFQESKQYYRMGNIADCYCYLHTYP